MDKKTQIKKRLYMMQACDKPDGLISIPYSIGVLVSSVWRNETIRCNYEMCGLLAEKLSAEDNLKLIERPDIVAFSCYIWNFEYSKYMAKKIKEKHPGCIIIFGGHSIPLHNSNFLSEHQYVDFLLHGEGEISFGELLLYFCGEKTLKSVHNVSYLQNGRVYYQFDSNCIISDYPSPYTSGIFDGLVMSAKKYTATLETNRGCPFSCAYCDWGLCRARLRMMDLQKVFDDIEWMGRNRIITCFGADSNFGMFPRDLEIAKKIAEVKKRYGYPRKFSVSFSKQSNRAVLEICRILNECGALAGATLSFQSLNTETLRLIGRSNLSMKHFRDLIAEYNKEKIPTYSELILALPGETYDSFVDGVSSLISYGQYRYINVYDFALLTNSELGREAAITKHGLKTVKIPTKLYYCHIDNTANNVSEFSNIVVETSTMSRENWVKCKMFTAVIKGFHSYGLLLYISTFLNEIEDVNYRKFYEALGTWIMETKAFLPYIELYKWLTCIASEEGTKKQPADIYNGYRIPGEEAAFLRIIEGIDFAYEKLSDFLCQYKGHDCWEELDRFQITVLHCMYIGDLPYKSFGYDFISFFNDVALGRPAKLIRKNTYVTKNDVNTMLLLPKKVFLPHK